MNKKYGFTLVELVAVIVVIGIVVLIITLIVSNNIMDSKKKANMMSATQVIKSANAYFLDAINSEIKSIKLDGSTNVLDDLILEGEKPTGYVFINKNGKIEVSLNYDDMCYVKLFDTDEIVVEDESCDIIE